MYRHIVIIFTLVLILSGGSFAAGAQEDIPETVYYFWASPEELFLWREPQTEGVSLALRLQYESGKWMPSALDAMLKQVSQETQRALWEGSFKQWMSVVQVGESSADGRFIAVLDYMRLEPLSLPGLAQRSPDTEFFFVAYDDSLGFVALEPYNASDSPKLLEVKGIHRLVKKGKSWKKSTADSNIPIESYLGDVGMSLATVSYISGMQEAQDWERYWEAFGQHFGSESVKPHLAVYRLKDGTVRAAHFNQIESFLAMPRRASSQIVDLERQLEEESAKAATEIRQLEEENHELRIAAAARVFLAVVMVLFGFVMVSLGYFLAKRRGRRKETEPEVKKPPEIKETEGSPLEMVQNMEMADAIALRLEPKLKEVIENAVDRGAGSAELQERAKALEQSQKEAVKREADALMKQKEAETKVENLDSRLQALRSRYEQSETDRKTQSKVLAQQETQLEEARVTLKVVEEQRERARGDLGVAQQNLIELKKNHAAELRDEREKAENRLARGIEAARAEAQAAIRCQDRLAELYELTDDLRSGLRQFAENNKAPASAALSALVNHALNRLMLGIVQHDELAKAAMWSNLHGITSQLRQPGFQRASARIGKLGIRPNRFPSSDLLDREHPDSRFFANLLQYVREYSSSDLAPYYFDSQDGKIAAVR